MDHSANVNNYALYLFFTLVSPLLSPPYYHRFSHHYYLPLPRSNRENERISREGIVEIDGSRNASRAEERDESLGSRLSLLRTKLAKVLRARLMERKERKRGEVGRRGEERRVGHIRTQSGGGGGGGGTRERNNYYLRPIGTVRLTILPATGTSGPRLGRDCSWEEGGEGGGGEVKGVTSSFAQ